MSTVADIISITRSLVLDDSDSQKYLWSDTELIHMLNRAYNELFKTSLQMKDQTTTAIVQIKLLSDLGVYAEDSRIIQITHARLQTNHDLGPLEKTTEQYLNSEISDWRSLTGTPRKYCPGAYSGYLSVYPKFDNTGEFIGSSDISFASTKTISQSGTDFSALATGDSVYVSGTTNNNGYKTVVTVGSGYFTVSETVTTESNTSATIRKVRDILLLSVDRLPSARFVVADIAAATPITELREDHIDGLTDGIAKRAFLKPDPYAYYPQKAESHRLLFEEFKREIKRDMILRHKPDFSRKIRSGTGIGF